MPFNPLAEKRLVARRDDAALNVHVVSEYLFCERAAVLAKECEEPDPGLEVRTVRLGYLPRYDERRLEAWVGRTTAGLLIGGGIHLAALLLGGLLVWFGWTVALVACWLLLALLVVGTVVGLALLTLLTWRLAAARGAKPIEPDFQNSEMVEVRWWSLLASGYELQQWPEPMTVERWRLTGRPWRVLVRGTTAIPVLLSKKHDGKLRKNHFARIAAYCSLLADQAGVESPYGVVLLAGTTDGVAVRNSGVSQGALADGVVGMRDLTRLIEAEPLFAKTPPPSHCYNCPLGQLKCYREPPVVATEAPPVLVERGGKHYQSACGLRFRWSAPHHSLQSRKTS